MNESKSVGRCATIATATTGTSATTVTTVATVATVTTVTSRYDHHNRRMKSSFVHVDFDEGLGKRPGNGVI